MKDAKLRTLLSFLVKPKSIRELSAIAIEAYILEKNAPVAQCVRKAGAKYAQAVKTEGKGHKRGPPVCTVAYDLITNLATAGVGVWDKQALPNLAARIDSFEIGDMTTQLEKAHDEAKVKLVISVREATD